MHLYVRLADLAYEGDPLLRSVQNMVLKPVEHLETEVDPEIGGEIREAGNALEAPRPVPRFVDRFGIVDRPVGMEGSAEDMTIELGEIGRAFPRRRHAPPCRMAGSAEDRFLLERRTQPRRDGEAVLPSGAIHVGDMGLAIAVQMMSGDLDNVETELGDLFDVFQAVSAPFLLPVRVVNAELHLRLQFDERTTVSRDHTANGLAKPPPTRLLACGKRDRPRPKAGTKVAWSYFLTISNSARSVGAADRKTMTAIRNRPQTAVERC